MQMFENREGQGEKGSQVGTRDRQVGINEP